MKRALAVAAALMLVASLAAPALAATSASAASAPSGMTSVPDDQITQEVPSGESIPVSAADLRGKVLASAGHADSLEVIATTPEHANEVMGSDANVVGSGQMALVFRDSNDHESREVAVDAGLLRQALGFTPETIHGTHSSGETWTSQAKYQDGYLSMQIESWSSNTVTFTGSVNISATPATDGSSFSYQLGQIDAASDPQISLTGVRNSETDVVSGSGTSGTISADIAGTKDPGSTTLTLSGNGFGSDTITRSASNVSSGSGSLDVAGSLTDTSDAGGASMTVTGRETSEWENTSASYLSDGSTMPLSIAGSVDPDGGRGVDPIIRITGRNGSGSIGLFPDKTSVSGSFVSGAGSLSIDAQDRISEGDDQGTLTLSVDGQQVDSATFSGGDTVSLSTSVSAGDHTWTVSSDETIYKVSGSYPNVKAQNPSVSFDTGQSVSVDQTLSNGETVTRHVDLSTETSSLSLSLGSGVVDLAVDFRERTQPKNVSVSLNGVSKSISGPLADGQTSSVSFAPSSLDPGTSNAWSIQTPSLSSDAPPMRLDYELSVSELDATKNPSVDVDRDGSPEASVSGLMTSSDSREFSIDPSLSDDEWAVSSAGSPLSVSAPITETSVPSDIAVSVNGHSVSHSGPLADGATDTLTADKSWLQEGSNTVSVSIGDGSLSSDAPDRHVDLRYGHSASDQVNVTYSSRAFAERYNITHTYASATSDAQVTIPFESSSVVGVKSVLFRVNGGDWRAVPADHYRFSNTTLDVYVADAYGAQIPAGATVDVRAAGRKIDVQNGAVSITDPSKPGEDLDTQLRIDARSSGFHVNVGPTANGPRVHYATSSLYPTSDYVIFNAHGDQKLYLPNSEVGDTFRVQYLQTKVVPQKGDVKVTVEKPGSNPKLDIDPGPAGAGDPVEFTYYRTTSGTEYLLNSLTKQVVRASGIAHSPVTLADDDSDELLQIISDGAASSSSGDGGGGGFWRQAGGSVSQLSTSASSSGLLPIAGIGLVGLVAVVVVGRRVFGDDLDASTGSGSSSTLGRIAIGGVRSASWAGRAFGRVTLTVVRLLNRGLIRVLSNKYAAAVLAIGGFLGAGQLGLVPRRAITLGSVIALLAGTIYGLRRLGIYSHRLFVLVGALVTVGAVELLSPGLLQQFVGQLPLALLAILAAAVLGIWFFFVRRSEASTPETVNRIMFNDNSGGGKE